ncbi:glucosamine 6-phosphate n-acetyltransferase [Anaeramoeba flamelloides]|uniref:Glucosamine 6-phosphate n-acetyltransferase n=1 Tax=Anaeramoeba flamelloides TaxID=1746091 RepID=A0AAV7Y5G4_9EUKA|nr:glucosamine 6-phosphate n-acetyltransferase [Anaeramoeba flamelloides]
MGYTYKWVLNDDPLFKTVMQFRIDNYIKIQNLDIACSISSHDGKDNAHALVYDKEEDLIGIASIEIVPQTKTIFFFRIVIRDDLKGQGIGTRVIGELIDQVRDNTFSCVAGREELTYTNIRLSSGNKLLGYYKRFGFYVIGERYVENWKESFYTIQLDLESYYSKKKKQQKEGKITQQEGNNKKEKENN